MNNLNFVTEKDRLAIEPRVKIHFEVGRYSLRTLNSILDLEQAFRLRYQVFQVEMIGNIVPVGLDMDEFDQASDHLGIFDTSTNILIATCRLNCSLFSNIFYTQQEFYCAELIEKPDVKLEIGRVCVHRDYRKGIVVMLLWRAISEYMKKTQARFLFGCGSVPTLDPFAASVVYRFLKSQGKVRSDLGITPTADYRSNQFDDILKKSTDILKTEELVLAQTLWPSLCRSYFDIGCFTPSIPAFDHEFKCIDFLTVLDVQRMDPQLRRKLLSD